MFNIALACRIKIILIFILMLLYVINLLIIIEMPTDDLFTEQRYKYDRVIRERNNRDVEQDESTLKTKRNKIKDMMLHAWKNYKLYAWGKNELNSIKKTYHNNSIFGTCEIGATIVDALDTLYIMELMEEYEEGRNWVLNEFSLDECNAFISVFELNIRFIGSFLSLYALTGDSLYKEKAKYVADKTYLAFLTPSKIPYQKINIYSRQCEQGMTVLADCGSLSLEFTYLSEITNDPRYANHKKEINKALRPLRTRNGLYPYMLDPSTGKYFNEQVLFGANADSFYEYLLKTWIQSGSKDNEMQDWFIQTIDSVMEYLIKTTSDGFYYTTGKYGNFTDHYMDHVSCFAGGFFALAAKSSIYPNSSMSLLSFAKELTRTCREMYVTSKTGLGPEKMNFSPLMHEVEPFYGVDRSYKLRPEVVESYFYLWRIMHEQKYRNWAWDVVQAIEKYCRTPFGYAGLQDVYDEDPEFDGVQQSFFLAETLKYLYLTFSNDSVLDLNKYVFNTEAHPLPIRNR